MEKTKCIYCGGLINGSKLKYHVACKTLQDVIDEQEELEDATDFGKQ
jgi:hypothetical protein